LQDVVCYSLNLAFSNTGTLYIGFFDWGLTGKAQVMKFDGVNWHYLGEPGFTPGVAMDLSLAISPAGDPYVVYVDFENDRKASVMYYDELVGIEEIRVPAITLCPNPVTSAMVITFPGNKDSFTASIYNSSGMLMMTATAKGETSSIDLRSLSPGIYFIRINGMESSGKIIKQ
jgi:hypothetical protein